MTNAPPVNVPTVDVDDRWLDIIKAAPANASVEEPFLTLVALLSTFVIVSCGPLWLVLHYRFKSLKLREQAKFERQRRTGK